MGYNDRSPEISVIVPVYNGEKYLKEALDSILAQTFTDFELICVDDGSTDSSPEILEEYAKKDDRIRILRQKNRFAGIARNNGMRQARGAWLSFLDADDIFSPKLLEKMYDKAQEDDADICIADAYYYHELYHKTKIGRGFLAKQFLPEKRPFSKEDIEDRILNITTTPVWNKLFRADFIREHGIEFTDARFAEDAGFMLPALLLAERITTVEDRLVHYRVGAEGSATSRIDRNIFAGYETLYREKLRMIEKGLYTENIRDSFANKALGNALFFVDNAATQEGYIEVYDKLVKCGGFEDLDVTPDRGYYDKKHEARMRAMLDAGDAYAYLFWRYRQEVQTKEKFTYEVAELKEKLQKEREKVKALREKNREFQQKITDIRNSHTFKVGSIIMQLPRKLKQMFRGEK